MVRVPSSIRSTAILSALAALAMLGGMPAAHAKSLPLAETTSDGADDWVRADHVGRASGRQLRYRSTAGTIGLKDEQNKERARMFFVAYTVEQAPGSPPRPITFFFNGGPGSSSIWLHMGSFGPVRIAAPQPGQPETAPYTLTDNRFSLLGKTDLVFLDAIGTGYSRATETSDNRLFWGNDQDADSFAQAISRYLTLTGRWNAPKFLFGESFGTMRAAILAPKLHDRGIDLNGIIMMSTILNFGHFAPGLDQAAIDLLPTYAATAHYHKRAGVKDEDLATFLDRARSFARGPYAAALAKGDLIDTAERRAVAIEMSEFTGLSADYIERQELRIGLDEFRRQLLTDRKASVGAMDTRYVGQETLAAGANATYDPSETQIKSAYASAFNDYASKRLGYRTGLEYVLSDGRKIMGAWDWSHKPAEGERQNSLANSVYDLAVAMRQTPKLKVLVLNGYYDLLTPFHGAEFDLARLGLGPANRERVKLRYYASGHMIYLDDKVMPQLDADIGEFYADALRP